MLAYHLIVPVQEFSAAHPAVCLNLRPSVRIDEVARSVEQGPADLGVLPYFPEEPGNPHLDYEPLFEMQLMLLTSARHPLARKKHVEPRDLVQYPLIMGQEGTHSRVALERLLRRHGLIEQVQVVLESSHAEVIRSYVASGIGVAVLFTGGDEGRSTAGLHRRVFDPDHPSLPVAMAVRKGAHLSEPVQEFRRIVRRCLAKP
jgi:DNA-binding transcriptional LysR family regulator